MVDRCQRHIEDLVSKSTTTVTRLYRLFFYIFFSFLSFLKILDNIVRMKLDAYYIRTKSKRNKNKPSPHECLKLFYFKYIMCLLIRDSRDVCDVSMSQRGTMLYDVQFQSLYVLILKLKLKMINYCSYIGIYYYLT